MASLLLLLSLGFPSLETRATCKVRVAGGARPDNGYVGSKMCAECHQAIYRSFTRTDMGRSMSTTASVALPAVSHYFDAQLNRHSSVSLRQGQLYQTEWETDENGKDLFRDTQPIEWLLGAGANGFGALVRRGDHILEAPR